MMPHGVVLPMMLRYCANELKLDWWTGRVMKHFFFEQQEHKVGRAFAYMYQVYTSGYGSSTQDSNTLSDEFPTWFSRPQGRCKHRGMAPMERS